MGSVVGHALPSADRTHARIGTDLTLLVGCGQGRDELLPDHMEPPRRWLIAVRPG